MAEITNHSPNPKVTSLNEMPRRLTKQEIESLRQDKKDMHKYLDEAFKHLKGTLAPKK